MASFFGPSLDKVKYRLIRAGIYFALVFGVSACAVAKSTPVISYPLDVEVGTLVQGPNAELVYRGGVELNSTDPRFGGLSGLMVSEDGSELLAISDRGWWVGGNLLYDNNKNLLGLNEVFILPMKSMPNKKRGKEYTLDAEALTKSGDGTFVVAFEREHRLWEYSGLFSSPRPIKVFDKIVQLPFNSGVEALVWLGPGILLGIAEGGFSDQQFLGFQTHGNEVFEFSYSHDNHFRPSDAVALDGGGVLILERGYTKALGVSARLMLLSSKEIEASTTLTSQLLVDLDSPLPLDNFEGLAQITGRNRETLIYIISDNNYSSLQRTLLLMFELILCK